MWKIGAVVGICLALVGSGFLLGRFCFNGPRSRTGEELYQDSVNTISDVRDESDAIAGEVESLGGEVGKLDNSITASTSGIESSVGVSRDIETDSGEIGDIAESLKGDIADIGATSRGLADLFRIGAE
jgi:hypothetical protein